MRSKEKVLNYLKSLSNKYTIEYIGNNLNKFLNTEELDKIIKEEIKIRDPRKIRASLDVLRGKLFEEIIKFLLNKYFEKDKSYSHIKADSLKNCHSDIKQLFQKIALRRRRINPIKTPDVDIIVYSKKYNDRIIILSVKGTARERIGQFLSNIFIFDKNVIEAKYGAKLYYFNEKLPKYKMMFICFDMAKHGDFSFTDEEKAKRKRLSSVKQIEVFLIDDDPNVGYGVFVMNNLYKLQKVGNFSLLVAKLKEFFP